MTDCYEYTGLRVEHWLTGYDDLEESAVHEICGSEGEERTERVGSDGVGAQVEPVGAVGLVGGALGRSRVALGSLVPEQEERLVWRRCWRSRGRRGEGRRRGATARAHHFELAVLQKNARCGTLVKSSSRKFKQK